MKDNSSYITVNKSFVSLDEALLVQCFDYENSKSRYCKWDGESYEMVDSYVSQEEGIRYAPHEDILMLDGQEPIINFPERPVDHGSFEDLFNEIIEFIRTYGDISEEDERKCAYFVMFTWIYDKAPVTPYLRFIGDSGKGKSRLLTTVGHLCFLSYLAGSFTYSGIMRFHNDWRGTALMDEADYSGNQRSKLTKWINNGIERSKPVIMSHKDNPSRQESFNPFGPKAFAMRQRFDDPATESRVISIEMESTDRDDIDINLHDDFHQGAQELRNKLLDMRMKHYWDIDATKEPQELKELPIENRILQIFMPLVPLIRKSGGEEAVERFKDNLMSQQEELRQKRATSPQGLVFNTLYDLATNKEAIDDFSKFRTKESNKLCAVKSVMIEKQLGYQMDKRKVGEIVRELGFDTRNKRIPVKVEEENDAGIQETVVKKEQHRCIVLDSKQKWNEIASRYLLEYDEDEEISVPECLKSDSFTEE